MMLFILIEDRVTDKTLPFRGGNVDPIQTGVKKISKRAWQTFTKPKPVEISYDTTGCGDQSGDLQGFGAYENHIGDWMDGSEIPKLGGH